MQKKTKKDYVKLIQKHFPNLEFKKTKMIRKGCDNDVVVLDNRLIFRFPKSEDCTRRFQAEVKLLKHLKERVNLAIPNYIYLPGDKSFGGYEMLKGQEMHSSLFKKLSREKKQKIARQIGIFLSFLHSTQITTAEKAGFPDLKEKYWYSRYSVSKRYEKIKTLLFPRLSKIEVDWIQAEFEKYLSLPQSSHSTVIHGDFSSDHILFDPITAKITGILDFTDMQIAAPESEFGKLWKYGEEFVEEIVKAYKPPLSPHWKEKSKFTVKADIITLMYNLMEEKNFIIFEKIRKKLNQLMKK